MGLEKQHKPIREIEKLQEWPNQQFHLFILKKKKSTEMLERPGRPQKASKMDDGGNLSWVKKHPSQHQEHSKEGTIVKVCNQETT